VRPEAVDNLWTWLAWSSSPVDALEPKADEEAAEEESAEESPSSSTS
jgi:hypothetical protein